MPVPWATYRWIVGLGTTLIIMLSVSEGFDVDPLQEEFPKFSSDDTGGTESRIQSKESTEKTFTHFLPGGKVLSEADQGVHRIYEDFSDPYVFLETTDPLSSMKNSRQAFQEQGSGRSEATMGSRLKKSANFRAEKKLQSLSWWPWGLERGMGTVRRSSFIPRLGKRKRNNEDDSGLGVRGGEGTATYFLTPAEVDILEDNWSAADDGAEGDALSPPHLMRGTPTQPKRKLAFLPRLGKRRFLFTPRLGKRSLSFVPRLGKRPLLFAPRLGKREEGMSRSPKVSYFVPRLG